MSDRRSKPKFRERKRKMAVAARVWVYLGWVHRGRVRV